jgi:hypothetical protein
VACPDSLFAALRQRLAHNETYLAQKMGSRLFSAQLSYGEEKTADWVLGEQSAIEAENEWIRALLGVKSPPATEPEPLHAHD